jgi:hypothetical protein
LAVSLIGRGIRSTGRKPPTCHKSLTNFIRYSNMTSFFQFVDKRAIYRWYKLIRTCAGECDWLFHWQDKLCATFSASVNINYRLPIKVCYRICSHRHIRIEIIHGNQNVFWVATWVGGYYYILSLASGSEKILISANSW